MTGRLRRIKAPYAVGLLARAEVQRWVAYGRSLGLQVENHHDGGWLTRRGWIVATGPDFAMQRYRAYLEAAPR